MKKSAFKRWSKIRKKGKLSYILKYGILFWGIPTGILAGILLYFIEMGGFTFQAFTQIEFYGEVIARVLFFALVGGPLYGILTWVGRERKWNKEKGERN